MKKIEGIGLLLISLCFSASVVFSGQWQDKDQGTPMKMNDEQLRNAEKALANHEAKLMGIPGVVGVGMGLTENGDRPAIHVYVNVEATGGQIPAAIPGQIDNIPIRIIKTDEIKVR
jgi:hypothetical protein